MTDKELRKLKRSELLEIMVVQSREIDRLNRELEDARAKLASRELMLEKTGSIAEASIKLYEVFEKAQAAADLYLENVRRITSEAAGEAAQVILSAQTGDTSAAGDDSAVDGAADDGATGNNAAGDDAAGSERADKSGHVAAEEAGDGERSGA